MTIIENDGLTILVRLNGLEIEALKRQIDGRSLSAEQKEKVRDIWRDLSRFEPAHPLGVQESVEALQDAINILESKGYEVRNVNGLYYLRTKEGKPVSPRGMTIGSLKAQARFEKEQAQKIQT